MLLREIMGAPSAPAAPPPPPPPPPMPDIQAAHDAIRKNEALIRKPKGRSSTLLTNQLGSSSPVSNVATTSLLGQ